MLVKIDHYLNLLRLPRMGLVGVAASVLIFVVVVKFFERVPVAQGSKPESAPKQARHCGP